MNASRHPAPPDHSATATGSDRAASIAVVVPEMLPVPPVLGGAVEQWVHEFTRRLAERTPPLAVISRPAGIAGPPGIEYLGVPWTATERFFYRLKERLNSRNPLRYLAKIQNVWSYARRATRCARAFDVVYLHNEPNILLFMPLRSEQRIILHMHNDHLTMRVFRPFYRRALKKAHLVLFVSDYIRRRALAVFPEFADRFKTVLNATDPELFTPGAASQESFPAGVDLGPPGGRILFVGRVTPIKGVHVLIKAFSGIRARFAQARLIIVGSSFFGEAVKTPYELELARLAEPLGDAVVFTGYVPQAALRSLYAACDVLVVPSIWQEPFGLVVLEAMASGTCVVASAVGGLPEIIEHRRTGILIPAADVGALAGAVCELLADAGFRRRLEEAARAAIERRFTWSRLIDEVDALGGLSA
jgi:spore coat protein SA